MRRIFPVFLCLMFYVTCAWSESVNEAEKILLQKTLQQLGSFQANYDQRVENKSGRVLEQSKGYFALAENKKFRSDVNKPYQLQTLSDGYKLWIIDRDLEQVTIGFLSDYLKDSPIALLLSVSGDEDNNNIRASLEAFSVQHVKNEARQQELFKLHSLDKQTLFSEIRFGLRQNIISYIELDERSGNRVRLNFTDVKKLPAGSDDLFKAKFPDSFELIDDTLVKAPNQAPQRNTNNKTFP